MSAFGGKADIVIQTLQCPLMTRDGRLASDGARTAGVSELWNAETASRAARRLSCIAVPRSITVLVAAAIAILRTSAVGSPVITPLCKPMFMPGRKAFG
jgi:hypothetical protein